MIQYIVDTWGGTTLSVVGPFHKDTNVNPNQRVRIMTDFTEKKIELSDAERQPCEVWTRVMGYFRPVSEFNIGKKSEYAERVCFKESKATDRMMDVAAE